MFTNVFSDDASERHGGPFDGLYVARRRRVLEGHRSWREREHVAVERGRWVMHTCRAMTERCDTHFSPLLTSRRRVPVPGTHQKKSVHACRLLRANLRAAAKGLRCRPYSLGAVISEDVQPVLERLNASLDIEDAPFAVVAPAVSKIGRAFGMPHGRVRCIYPDRVCILEHDVCTLHVRCKVVVLRNEMSQRSK